MPPATGPRVISEGVAGLHDETKILSRLWGLRPLRWSLVPDVIGVLIVTIVALWPIVQFLRVALSRMNYPFELEWMEGGIVDHIRIALAGQSLYREPSMEFTPFIYVPGYYYVSAIVAKMVGIGFLAPRLVSTLSIFGCFILLAKWVHNETHSFLAAMVTTGLFAATYGQSEFWFDIARVDSFFFLLLLSGYYFVRFGHTRWHGIVGGALLALSALTKQVGLVLALPALGYLVWRSWKHGIWAWVTFLALLISLLTLLEVTSHGWFSFYAFRLPADHSLEWGEWRKILQTQFWGPVAPMVLGTLALVMGNVRRLPPSLWALYAAGAIVAIGTSYSSILHTGGYPNVLIPAHAVLATCFGLVFAHVWQSERVKEDLHWRWPGNRIFAVVLFLIQMALLPPIHTQALIPSSDDRTAGHMVLAAIKASPGPVWIISSGYYPLLLHGSGVTSHAMGFTDVFKSGQNAVKHHLLNLILTQIREKRFKTIVRDRVTGFLPNEIAQEIERFYRLKQQLLQPYDGRFWPKSGASVRPDEIWEPIPEQSL